MYLNESAMIHIMIHEDGSYTWRHLEFYWINTFQFLHILDIRTWFIAGVIKTKHRLFHSTNRTKREFIEILLRVYWKYFNRNPGRFGQFMFCRNGSKKFPNTIVLNSRVTTNFGEITEVSRFSSKILIHLLEVTYLFFPLLFIHNN